jgi:hypothetical protein
MNVGGALLAIGIVCCAILTLLDLKIKNDLIQAAIDLDRKIREYRQQGQADFADNSDDNLPGSVPMHTENHHDTGLEVEIVPETIPESKEVRQTRDNRGRFQAKG